MDTTEDTRPCSHPEADRQAMHHHGIPVELCRACGRTRGRKAALWPESGRWGAWMPGIHGWASAPEFAIETRGA